MNEAKRLKFYPGKDDYGRRIDRVLRKFLPSVPLGALYGALRKKDIRINGRKTQPEYKLVPGDVISVTLPFTRKWGIAADSVGTGETGGPEEDSPSRPAPPSSVPILHETSDLLVLDKPAGILIHGPGSLEENVRGYLAPKLPPSLSFSPGPLHRLDRNTSGVVFFGKSTRGARSFSELLREGRIIKEYLAVVGGNLDTPAKWIDRIDRDEGSRRSTVRGPGEDIDTDSRPGKTASLTMEPLAAGNGVSLVRFVLHTGRTHQIRAQAASRGVPLLGDVKYGGPPLYTGETTTPGKGEAGPPPYLLHAHRVRSADAEAAGEIDIDSITAVPPDYFLEVVDRLFGPGIAEKLRDPSTGGER
jgi:23S rRNA pseudouridine955/2504/2580 synthase